MKTINQNAILDSQRIKRNQSIAEQKIIKSRRKTARQKQKNKGITKHSLIKRHRMIEWLKKEDPSICCLKSLTVALKTYID